MQQIAINFYGEQPQRQRLTLRELPVTERPSWRLHHLGAQALTSSELISIILGTDDHDVAEQLIAEFSDWRGLQQADFEELVAIPGMDESKAARLKASLELGRRGLLEIASGRVQITHPSHVADLLMAEMGALDHEELRVICLTTQNHIQRITTISIGMVDAASLRIAEVFKLAVKLNSRSIILVHNHPSGQNPNPSPADIAITRQIIQAGQLLDIEVADHIIISSNSWTSMKDRRLCWP